MRIPYFFIPICGLLAQESIEVNEQPNVSLESLEKNHEECPELLEKCFQRLQESSQLLEKCYEQSKESPQQLENSSQQLERCSEELHKCCELLEKCFEQLQESSQPCEEYVEPVEEEECPPCASSRVKPFLEAKAGYFFFSDHTMSDVYDGGGIDVQLSSSYPIWQWLQVYGSLEYLQKSGKSLVFHEKTSIWEIPLSLGLRGIAKVSQWSSWYLTIGPRYVFAHVDNDSPFVDRSLNQNGIGGFVNTGFYFSSCGRFFVDLFGEYSYVKLHFHPKQTNVQGRSAQVGGFTFGGGLGYQF